MSQFALDQVNKKDYLPFIALYIVKSFEEIPTPELEKKISEEWERISTTLINYNPSNETLQWLLKDLLLMHEELKRRKENKNP